MSFRALARVLATATILCAVAISFAPAQSTATHPDFSGTWVLDAARSEKSTFTPAGATYTVRQGKDTLVVDRETTSANGTVTKAHMVYGFDGRSWKNTLPLVGQMVEQGSVLSWEAGSLVIRSSSQADGNELSQVDTWTMQPDGKSLTMKREAKYAGAGMGAPVWLFVRK